MDGIEKLNRAKLLLEDLLKDSIVSTSINYNFKRFHMILKDGINIYITYNNHDEYSYSVIFSKLELDRCRFDNYDKVWDVPSQPHHFHPRFKKEGVQSDISGNPNQDMPLLYELLKSGKLYI